MTLLAVENLTVRFGTTRAVERVSFALDRGRTLGLVGESGSGKSTVAAALLRLLPPAARVDSGRILFDGVDIAAAPERELESLRGRRIAMIFQEPTAALDPVMTIGEQVAEPFLLHGGHSRANALAEAHGLLERVGIPAHRADSYPFQLSGGQRQRTMIAAAIALQPDLLIADEPTTALDVTVQKGILDLLLDLQQEIGMAMVFISHDLAVVSTMADDVAVMRRGVIVESGAVGDVLGRPNHPYTQALLDAARTRVGPIESAS
ncbi:MAG TPA: ABC transporter ATP-binding protein [Alphaproteobacteria bacterium]|jgi:ABC-type dipeptide/oligopeptide/nickel transport system ATPase component|nr:ABC transporter ATP-binding protein [Alphaproteobacteria bacterium]